MRLPPLSRHDVGFDYARALTEISEQMTYDQIAEYCGYENRASIFRVMNGAIPPHPQGEAIWSLYCVLFGRKPPLVSVEKPIPLSCSASSA